jgi:ribonuclease BN (tRNA processing enzyme)
MKVVLLGTGGPRPDPRRNATTTLIRIGEENILFDAGRGVVLQLVRAGVPLAAVNPVFITHHHVDHIGDLYDVMLATWMHGRKEPLRIFGPPETRRIVETLLKEVYGKDWQWRSIGEPSFGGWQPVTAEDVVTGMVLDTGRWRVSADTVNHGDGLGFPPEFLKRWICYGYRFEAQGKIIAISGDTIPCAGIDRLARDADVLVHCCYMASAEAENEHFRRLLQHTMSGGDTVGKTAARAGAKTLVLTHHRPRTDDGMLATLAEEVARDFAGRIVIGEDLMEIEV